MDVSKKGLSNTRFIPSGSLKKNGIVCWRYVFNATEKDSGTEKSFFIELEMLNSSLSTSEPVLGFKQRNAISSEDLQYALAGTMSATEIQSENLVQPSYICIRFGSLGQKGKHISFYESLGNATISTKPFEVHIGTCIFTENHLSGFISCTQKDLALHPEYLCQEGYAEWNLDFEIIHEFDTGFQEKSDFWAPLGCRTNFSGTISWCGTDYVINPLTSFGYYDKYWGKSLPNPWFHISASSLSSLISGRTMFESSFAVHGLYGEKAVLLLDFEGNRLVFNAEEHKKNSEFIWDCQEISQNDYDELHWSVSIHNKQWVVDIDIFCKVNELCNKVIELPEGNRKTMSVVSSCSGTGEIKLYKVLKNTLEQIEYLRIAKAFCEFGRIEEGEN